MEQNRALKLSLKNALNYALLVLFFAIPFHRNFSTITIIIIVVLSIVEQVRRKSLPKSHPNWFLPMLFIYYLVSNLLSGGSLSSIERTLLLLVVPLMFFLNQEFYEQQLKNKIYVSYILGILTAEAVCLSRSIYNSVSRKGGHLIFNSKVFPDSDYDFLTASIRDGNYFFGEDFSFILHPIYFGLYIVFAQYLIFEVYKSSSSKRVKSLLAVCYLMQFLFLFLLSSKAAIISSLILTFVLIVGAGISRFAKGLAIASVSVLVILFFFFNPRMKVFKDTFLTRLTINPSARFGHDLRILSWDASIEVARSNWLFGVGEGKKESALMDVYVLKGYIFPAKDKLNSHNQYLDFLMGGGIFGLSIFGIGLLTLFYQSTRHSNFPLLIFVLIFSFMGLFENLLSRHAGILIFSLFVTLFENKKTNQSNSN